MRKLITTIGLIILIFVVQSQSIYDNAFQFLDIPNSSGGIVAVGRLDSLLFKKAYGLANKETEKIVGFKILLNVRRFGEVVFKKQQKDQKS